MLTILCNKSIFTYLFSCNCKFYISQHTDIIRSAIMIIKSKYDSEVIIRYAAAGKILTKAFFKYNFKFS